jgi:hypothetical protein
MASLAPEWRVPLAREDDWLRLVILEENRPQECEKRMRAPAMVNYSLARRPRWDPSNNVISKNETKVPRFPSPRNTPSKLRVDNW